MGTDTPSLRIVEAMRHESRRFRIARLALAALLCGGFASAADFGFSVILQAGRNNAGQLELGIGSAAAPVIANVGLTSYWGNNVDRNFRVGYTASTNTAFVGVQTASGGWQTVNYTPPVGAFADATTTWTLPGSSFSVQALPNNRSTAITVSNLSFASTPGINVTSGLSSTTLSAAQVSRNTSTATLSQPVIFRPAGSGGDWLLTGQIRFAGLSSYINGGARADQLAFRLTANAVTPAPVPEPGTLMAASAGLILIGLLGRRRSRKMEAGKL